MVDIKMSSSLSSVQYRDGAREEKTLDKRRDQRKEEKRPNRRLEKRAGIVLDLG